MKFSAISALTFAAVAAATGTTTVTVTAPPSNPTPPPASQCNTDHLYCCNNNSLVAADDPLTGLIFGLLNIVVQPLTAIVGLGAGACNSITVAGLLNNGNTCNQSPVCCQNNQFSGLVVIGCSPVTLGA